MKTADGQHIRSAPLEVHQINYRGLAPEDYGKLGWATVGNEGPDDYIWYGPAEEDRRYAAYQAAITNRHYGFGQTVVVGTPKTAFLDYQVGQWMM